MSFSQNLCPGNQESLDSLRFGSIYAYGWLKQKNTFFVTFSELWLLTK
jgi:hypothetical protein